MIQRHQLIMNDVEITNITRKIVNPNTISISNQVTKTRDVGITEAAAINIQIILLPLCVFYVIVLVG